MRYLFACIMLAAVTAITGCTDKLTFEPEHNLVVVQAYLYAGEAVKDVYVTSTLGLGSTESQAPPITDAQVQVVKNGECCYELQPAWWKKGYYY